jgi:PIN domain nuclease of toxin-antitoxin system
MAGLVVDTQALVWYLLGSPRLSVTARSRLDAALAAGELAAIDRGVVDAVARVDRDSVPDMPDRIIAATALHLGLPLVTRDRKIRGADLETIW